MSSGITVTGQQKIIRKLAKARQEFSTIVRDVELGAFIERRILDRFDAGVDANNRPWADLLPQTYERRKRAGVFSNKPLVRTGALRRAIHQITGRADGLYAINTGLGFRVGIDDEEVAAYGRTHNLGTFSGQIKRKQLKRQFLAVSELDVRAARAKLDREVRRIIRG